MKSDASLHWLCVLSCFSRVWLFVTLRTVANQAPLSMGLSRQEYWSGLPWHPPGYLPNPGIEPSSLLSPGLASRFFTISTIWEATHTGYWFTNNQEETQWIPHLLHPLNTREFSKGYRKKSWLGGSLWGKKMKKDFIFPISYFFLFPSGQSPPHRYLTPLSPWMVSSSSFLPPSHGWIPYPVLWHFIWAWE